MENNKKLKLLIATPIYPPEIGGPATYTKELAERIGNEFDITILTYADKNKAPVFPNTKLVVIDKNKPMVIRLFLYTLKAISLARKNDVIYVQNAMAAGLPVCIASKLTKKPYVLKFVGDEAWERATQRNETKKFLEDFLEHPEGSSKIKRMMRIQGYVLRRANIVTTPSKYLGEALVKNYKVAADRMRPNYNASDDEERKLPFEPLKQPHQIVATARLTAWKGIDGIIRSVKILREKYNDVSAVIAGDGPEFDNLKKLASELGIEGNVKFLGRVSRDETFKIRKESSVYVLNSTYEGLPHTALTSFQAQIPIVATNIPGTNEAVYHEQSGLLVPPNNPDALAKAIERLFENQALGEQLVEGGQKILKEKFSWGAHITNLKSFFEKVLKN